MPRILLLLPTTTYRTEAFLTAARQMDVEVTIGSEQPNTLARLNPTAFLTLNFHDPQHTARQVVDFAAKHPIDAVVAVDDQVTVAAAVVCEALALRQNSVESVLAAGNKHRMRQLFQLSGVPSPGFRLCRLDDDPEHLAGQVHYPCVVKPLGLSGSQGVIRADDEPEFVWAVDRLARILQAESRKRKAESRGSLDDTDFSVRIAEQGDLRPSLMSHFLVEDFIGGPEIALEGLLSRGELRVLALFDKPDPLEGPFFEETIYVTPSRLPAVVQEQIESCTSQAVRALGLSEGPIHAELRLGVDGPSVIEVNARSIGGQCSRMLRFGVGISLEELIIRHALGSRESRVESQEPEKLGILDSGLWTLDSPAGVMMIPIPQAGKLSEVRGLHAAESVAGIEGVTISAHLGQELLPLPEGSVYLGFLFARASSAKVVEAALREAHAKLEVVIEPFDSNTAPAKTPFLQAHFQS